MGRIKNLIRNLNYLSKHSLWDQRENDIVYLTNKILDDAQYEFNLTDGSTLKPVILNSDESFELIMNTGKSFVRTGDGEIKIMMGMDQPFQKYDSELADGLRKLLSEKSDNLLVGINRNYYIPGYIRDYSQFYRRNSYDYRQYYRKILNPRITYIDATLTGFQFGTHKEKSTIDRYEKWKNAFKDKDVVIVCGEGVLDKLQYDVFEKAKNKKYIYGPNRNAWSKKESLIAQIKKTTDKDSIIVFILGMAGKVMTAELAEEGYICWDVGHLAKYYDAFMHGIENTDENVKKFYEPD